MIHSVEVALSTMATSAYVALQGTELGLANDGDGTWKGSEELDLSTEIALVMKVRGLNGTAWSISITLDGAARPHFRQSGIIETNNYSLLKTTIPVKKPARKDNA